MGKIGFLKKKEELSTIVFKWLTKPDREVSEQDNHCRVGHDDEYVEKGVSDQKSTCWIRVDLIPPGDIVNKNSFSCETITKYCYYVNQEDKQMHNHQSLFSEEVSV